MNNAELRVVREGLGLSVTDMAEHFGVNPRTVRSWESGRDSVPPWVAEGMGLLEAVAKDEVDLQIATLQGSSFPLIALDFEEDSKPAGWQRAIAFRVRESLPSLQVVDSTDQSDVEIER